MSQKSITMGNYLVASLDVLGAKEMLENNEEQFVQTLHDTYISAIAKLTQSNNRFYFNKSEEFREWVGKREYRIFSDNLLIYTKLNNPLNSESFREDVKVNIFLNAVRQVQSDFLDQGILLRGGIASGKFFADDIMVIGSALVDAYLLESKLAIYPRVILSEELGIYLKENPKQDLITIDKSDNKRYLDYLYFYNQYKSKNLEEWVCSFDKVELLDDATKQEQLYQKYTNLCQESLNKLDMENEKSEEQKKENDKKKVKFEWHLDYLSQKQKFTKKVLEYLKPTN